MMISPKELLLLCEALDPDYDPFKALDDPTTEPTGTEQEWDPRTMSYRPRPLRRTARVVRGQPDYPLGYQVPRYTGYPDPYSMQPHRGYDPRRDDPYEAPRPSPGRYTPRRPFSPEPGRYAPREEEPPRRPEPQFRNEPEWLRHVQNLPPKRPEPSIRKSPEFTYAGDSYKARAAEIEARRYKDYQDREAEKLRKEHDKEKEYKKRRAERQARRQARGPGKVAQALQGLKKSTVSFLTKPRHLPFVPNRNRLIDAVRHEVTEPIEVVQKDGHTKTLTPQGVLTLVKQLIKDTEQEIQQDSKADTAIVYKKYRNYLADTKSTYKVRKRGAKEVARERTKREKAKTKEQRLRHLAQADTELKTREKRAKEGLKSELDKLKNKHAADKSQKLLNITKELYLLTGKDFSKYLKT